MRYLSAFAVSVGLLPSLALGLNKPFLEVCSVEKVLEYFACVRPVPEACAADLAEQATAWCSDYLSIEAVTVVLSTQTPIVSETAIETSTTATTTTELTTTTTETTVTTSTTDIVQETVTTTTTLQAVQRRITQISSCPVLKDQNLLHHPASRLSKACSCINPQPTTVTVAVSTASETTATATETTVLTEVNTETSVAVEVTTATETDAATTTETTTATATATATATVDICGTTYNGGGNGVGNTVQSVPGVTSKRDCCERCLAKPNCIASASSGAGSCSHLVKIQPLAGAPVNEQCPLGVENYPGLQGENPNGVIFKGPCMT